MKKNWVKFSVMLNIVFFFPLFRPSEDKYVQTALPGFLPFKVEGRQGTCVPSPPRKMRMCLLTGWNCDAGWPNPRSFI